MIVKERNVPLKIKKLEALLTRIPENHPKRPLIEGDLAKSLAGFRGEQSLEYYLSFLSDSKYTIFHDLRLKNDNFYFQMDTLIVCSNFALIIEVKNISGSLNFDPLFNQLIRTINDKEEGFLNPITQVKRQLLQLISWLETNKFPSIPIEYLVVISNPSTILKTNIGKSDIHHRVCHAAQILEKVSSVENVYIEEKINSKDVKKLSRLLLKSHNPQPFEILQHYHIDTKELITGVHCPQCNSIPMLRKFGTWFCPSCNFKAKQAHVKALQDYFLLVNSTITNLHFREFLHIPSRHIATQLLNSLNYSYSGTNKGRFYYLPPK